MNPEEKDLLRKLWARGQKDLVRQLVASYKESKALPKEEAQDQFRIFSSVLGDIGLQGTSIKVDAKKGVVSFVVKGVSIVEFPRFISRVLSRLNDEGTREYKLDHVERKDPMRVFIRT